MSSLLLLLLQFSCHCGLRRRRCFCLARLDSHHAHCCIPLHFDAAAMRRLNVPSLRFFRSSCTNSVVGTTSQELNHGVRGGIGGTGWWLAAGIRRFSITEGQLPISQDMLTIVERGMLTIEHRHARLNQALSEPEAPPDEIVRLSKELSKLEDFMACIASLKIKRKEMEGLKMLIDDSAEDDEMKLAAAEELRSVSRLESEDLQRMLSLMLPKDEADSRGCILEVRAGTGGEEASLFALDIFRMYERFSQKKFWSFEVLSITQTDSKGCKEASASITGDGVYGKLKFESGVHRVQRVPVTEKSGRVHTSAASVAVLPQADEVDVQMRNEDLRVDTYRAGGAGGQHANTTSSAVRITHLPTGIVIAIQDERSQHMNRAKALKLLRAKLFEKERMQQAMARSSLRLEQIGSGDRSERIRTYNFPQGRVTDHRINITQHSIDQIMQGEGLDGFIDALTMKQEIAALASLKAAS